MKRVIVESPYAGDIEKNIKYARKALADCLGRGEAPFVSHLLYTQVLDDTIPKERVKGINAGFAWGLTADYVAVYADLGISSGMKKAIIFYENLGIEIKYRKIGLGRY